MVEGDDQLGAVPADGRRDVPAQAETVLDDAVAVVEELHGGHPDHGGARTLFGLAQGGALGGGDGVDARLAAGGQEVDDLAAAVRPVRDGGRAPVLEVVRVGHDGEGAPPVGGHGLQGGLQITLFGHASHNR